MTGQPQRSEEDRDARRWRRGTSPTSRRLAARRRCWTIGPGRLSLLLSALAAASVQPSQPALAQTGPCSQVSHERNAYTVCEVDLRKNAVRLYWRRPDGSTYAYLRSLPPSLTADAGRLLFATNAGMFDPAFRPVGLYVEQGRELVHANTKS